MNVIKKIAKVLLISLGSIMLIAGIYVLYVVVEFDRIEDNKNLTDSIVNNQNNCIEVNSQYKVITYNIGFGAYNQDFSFFMDDGQMKDSTVVVGKYSKAFSKEVVLENINGTIDTLKDADADFIFLQEVDEEATRSHKVNQLSMIRDELENYGSSFAYNFHSSYLFYPFNDPHGKTDAGILTLSKYHIDEVLRRSFPIDLSFPNKFFDLDRAFTINRLNVSLNKQLVLINLHMSAYDEGGKIRQAQLEMLNQVLREEYDKGNYVIAGGDFNHDITNKSIEFESEQMWPSWVQTLNSNDITSNYNIKYGINASTCRSTDIPYTKGVNFTVIIDGFIVSDNITVESINNIDLDYRYSDHNPVEMIFKLN